MIGYLLDEGVLITRENPEFDSYCNAYDKKYGYFDEAQCYIEKEEDAIRYAKEYAKNGVENTYAVVSKVILPADFDFREDKHIFCEEYNIDDVIYSVTKCNGKIIEGFISKPDLVQSNEVYSIQSYCDKYLGFYPLIKGYKDELRDILDNIGYRELWDFPLCEIEHIVEKKYKVVLVDCSYINNDCKQVPEFRWVEIPRN